MNDKSILIKIIPPKGYEIYRLEIGRRQIAVALAALFVLIGGAFGLHLGQLAAAQRHVSELQAIDAAQRAKLGAIDAQAGRLTSELKRLERQNAEIRRAIGITPQHPKRSSTHAVAAHRMVSFTAVASRLERVALESKRAHSESVELRHMVARVLNLRRIEAIARVRMLARIPSLIPAGDGGIASAFGFRTYPYPEFHRGIDLVADYGDGVRAAANGVVAFAGWDGGYGNKIVIDHGNGLATWYCHLSRIGVHDGQTVAKGERIGAVGSTGEATGPHLHYQIMRDGNAIDPKPFLAGQGAKVLGLATSGTLTR